MNQKAAKLHIGVLGVIVASRWVGKNHGEDWQGWSGSFKRKKNDKCREQMSREKA